ncbi:AcrR family transcriptional regulator [Paenibacillus rhizosphaerae]|uniref:AcrR family transcriptional regulator n=1 Tax=Paenibacillus rhizosphaerae TaxID=297318 RepID=A0A839U0R2_9BACL|nr:TetR/AcrR family transcriptional regulator [Paenibacillus rhizosphaerae]MBB3131228.1 AcrR family transcriptional regulator [Paenibacillus rhizosphaerae]
MSRPREFDVDRALHQSLEVFWTKGFKSTTFEDLTHATQVKKQSLYCVFKNKRDLFLKALALYREERIAFLEEMASREVSPLEKLEVICDYSQYQNKETCRGCFMANSAMEFGNDDQEVYHEVSLMFERVECILEKIIREGQEQGLVTNCQSSKELAAYLNNAISGARYMERAGASNEQINAVLHTSFTLMLAKNAR